MRALRITTFCLLLAMSAQAQRTQFEKTGEVTNFTVVSESPRRADVVLTAGMNLDLYKPNTSLAVNLGATSMMRGFLLFGHKNFALIDPQRRRNLGQDFVDYEKLSAATDFTLGGAYYLSDRTDTLTRVGLHFSLQNNGNNANRYTRYAWTPERRINMVRGTINRHRSIVNGEAAIDPSFPELGMKEYRTNMRTTSLMLGLGHMRVHDLEVDAKNYGLVSNSRWVSVFADLNIAFTRSFNDIQVLRSVVELKDYDDFRFMPLGLQVGGEAYFGRAHGYGGRVELGWRPGLRKDSNFFLMLSGRYCFKANTRVNFDDVDR